MNPTNLSLINNTMDKVLKGHPYCKSAIDMACWDILGKVTGLPVCDLLGGRLGSSEGFPLYRAISQDTAANMVANVSKYVLDDKYRKFQLKVGGNYKEDIERIIAVREILNRLSAQLGIETMPLMCDANTGWLRHEAMQV